MSIKTPLRLPSFALLAICSTLVSVCACEDYTPKEPAPPTVTNAPTPRPVGNIKAANPQKVVEGAALNKIFPPTGGTYSVIYTQEKKGFAQAEVSQTGKKLATLSISDTLANPEAKGKFANSSGQISGYPTANVGSQGTAILIGDRFQVQVRSLSPTFSPTDREAWLQKFNLDALKRLAGN